MGTGFVLIIVVGLSVVVAAAITRAAGARWIDIFLGIAIPLVAMVALLFLAREALRSGPVDAGSSVSNAPK
jgi:hypothetical protein